MNRIVYITISICVLVIVIMFYIFFSFITESSAEQPDNNNTLPVGTFLQL